MSLCERYWRHEGTEIRCRIPNGSHRHDGFMAQHHRIRFSCRMANSTRGRRVDAALETAPDQVCHVRTCLTPPP